MKTISELPLDYAGLMTRFPPRVIRSRALLKATLAEILQLKESRQSLNRDQREFLSLLELLVRRYEGPAQPKPAHTFLCQLISEHQLRKTDLCRILGRSLPLCSMILSGQRKITKEHAIRLGRYFGKGPDLFLA